MLAILVTHPIQYHVPLWQMLAADGRVPFEVWYLSEHATRPTRDREFQQDFAWDLDMLKGYPHRFLITSAGAGPNAPFRTWVFESLSALFSENKVEVLWVQGWQVAAYWQAVWAAHKAGVQVWLRGESNALREQGGTTRRRDDKTTGGRGQSEKVGGQLRKPSRASSLVVSGRKWAKRALLNQLFRRVDHFLCIGTANRELYRQYGVPEAQLHMAMYAVDNDRFRDQAEALRGQRSEIRGQWGIPENAFCVLFCGKFIPKKRPLDLVKAARLLITDNSITDNRLRNLHLLFVGSGELGAELRASCNVVFDAEQGQPDYKTTGQQDQSAVRSPWSVVRGPSSPNPINREPITDNQKPRASFAGFLNQTEVSRAYVAADVLVLPSDYGETWGLVVNEAMASGLPCIISDRCGCAPDLGTYNGNYVYRCGDTEQLTEQMVDLALKPKSSVSNPPSLETTVEVVQVLYSSNCAAIRTSL
jgi:glycosyltransferase involved in cell wall biosynthesis